MKKLCVGSLALLVLGLLQTALAAEGKVTFNGKLVDTTCTVSSDSQNMTVQLPTLSIKQLDSANKKAGLTLFTINIEGCAQETKARAYFEPLPSNVNLTTGRLINQAASGKAENVEVELVDSDGSSVINAAGTGGNQNSQLQTVAQTKGSLNYFARYYATGTTSAGAVQSAVDYYIEYE